MIRRKHQVHKIPTDKPSILYAEREHGGINAPWILQLDVFKRPMEATGYRVPHHLYFTTDEEIKEGDWFISKNGNLHQAKRYTMQHRGDRKIVATTNPDLWKPGQSSIRKGEPDKINVDFIEAFVKEQGIWEVMLETQLVLTDRKDTESADELYLNEERLKLNSQGAVVVHKVKEKMHPRSEMIKAAKDFANELLTQQEEGTIGHAGLYVEDWFNKNYPE